MAKETLKCSSCGNSNLKREGLNTYKCEYCGAITVSMFSAVPTETVQIDDAELDEILVETAQKDGLAKAIVNYRIHRKKDLKTSKEYVEKLCKSKGIKLKKTGCFIATACYGSYEAPEVVVLRKFRDQKLMKTLLGRAFVTFYYFVSPAAAKFIEKNDTVKKVVKNWFIEYLYRYFKSRL